MEPAHSLAAIRDKILILISITDKEVQQANHGPWQRSQHSPEFSNITDPGRLFSFNLIYPRYASFPLLNLKRILEKFT